MATQKTRHHFISTMTETDKLSPRWAPHFERSLGGKSSRRHSGTTLSFIPGAQHQTEVEATLNCHSLIHWIRSTRWWELKLLYLDILLWKRPFSV